MCGICGIINLSGGSDDLRNPLELMTKALRHRGPDDEGYLLVSKGKTAIYKGDDTSKKLLDSPVPYYPSEHIKNASSGKWSAGFGFRRLSILDLTIHGHQPMSYLDRYWIVFNGEIYNYIELKEELQKYNYQFETGTDTEVILAAYDHWGKDCLHHFNGMWAFVIYDSFKNKLFIARDRFGIKPLVYYLDHDKFIFASEIKSLLKSRLISTSPYFPYLDILLIDDAKEFYTETAFSNILRFPHGSYLEINIEDLSKDQFKPKKYYELQFNNSLDEINELTLKKYSDEYLFLIEDAVKLRLRADVPIGTCLSGGMDSTTVVWFINKILKSQNSHQQQKTFSLVFDSDTRTKYTDESKFIDDIVKLLNLNASKTSPDSEAVKSMYHKMVYTMDNPQISSLMSYMFTYKLVKEGGATITLDGQGADEQQVGYLPYLMNYFSNQSIFKTFNERSSYLNQPGYSKSFVLGSVFRLLRIAGLKDISRAILLMNNKLTDPFIHLNQRLYKDLNGNLVNLFHYGDRASMAFSIESRFPMMDYRLVEFWMKMPVTYKVHNGFTKYTARTAMNGKLPDSIVWRKDKMGWEIPQKVWFRQDLKQWFDGNIRNSEFLQDYLKVQKKNIEPLLNNQNINARDVKYLVKLHNLALWHKIFFENPSEYR
jgi:asparagine synthase (glutamine-hydrolysing)